jgi:ABC-type dipeptide/oligopeptide/nickel transport system permease component
MRGYVVKRVLLTLPILFAVATCVFVLARVAPGDPALVILGDQANAEALAALRHRLGIDRPLHVQYLTFLWDTVRGDLGTSLSSSRTVWSEIRAVLPFTLELTLAATLLGIAMGLPLGVLAALRRNRAADYVTRLLSLAGLSFPSFVSGILLVLAFAVQLRWFPVVSRVDAADPLTRLHNLVLPAVNLGLIMAAYVTRVTRSSMLGVLTEDYMRTARAKGLTRQRIIWSHGVRNALIPIVTVVGLYFGTMIGNSVLTEIVFNRPGVGKLILGALQSRDYTLLQGLMIVFAAFVVLVNLATDLVYGLVDPRVKVR